MEIQKRCTPNRKPPPAGRRKGGFLLLDYKEYQKRAERTEALTRRISASPFSVTAICAETGISIQSYYRWRAAGFTEAQQDRILDAMAALAMQAAECCR